MVLLYGELIWMWGEEIRGNLKYKQLYPTSAVHPKFYGLPKIHKVGTPLRSIVSSRGSITYGVDLVYIIKPLAGQSLNHLKNTTFHSTNTKQKAGTGRGYNLLWCKGTLHLSTSSPIHWNSQTETNTGSNSTTRTNMSIQQIVQLLEFCLTNTYFLFQGKYYKQVQGAAMGSPISPLIALNSCPHPPSLWLRFVDDTFVITKAEHSQPLQLLINNQDPHINLQLKNPHSKAHYHS